MSLATCIHKPKGRQTDRQRVQRCRTTGCDISSQKSSWIVVWRYGHVVYCSIRAAATLVMIAPALTYYTWCSA
eukprot:15017-Heterococcus_DN1.PRE.5